MKCSAVQCSVGKVEKWGFIGKVDMSCKVVRSERMGLKRDCKLCAKIYYRLHTVLSYLVCYPLYMLYLNPYPTAFPYGNGMVLHFYQQQESSTTKTVHKVINKGLKTYV